MRDQSLWSAEEGAWLIYLLKHVIQHVLFLTAGRREAWMVGEVFLLILAAEGLPRNPWLVGETLFETNTITQDIVEMEGVLCALLHALPPLSATTPDLATITAVGRERGVSQKATTLDSSLNRLPLMPIDCHLMLGTVSYAFLP